MIVALYRAPPSRSRLFSLPLGSITVTTDSGLACAILATQAADRAVATENPGRISSDGEVPLEARTTVSAGAIGDRSLPIEASAAVRSDRSAALESPGLLRGDMPSPVEWAGAAQLNVDAMVPFEGVAVVREPASVLTEADMLLLPQTTGAAESLVTDRADMELTAEALAALAGDTRSWLEWQGTGTTILIADAMLPLEWQQTAATLLLSLESEPGRIRLLATSGRVRLVRRN